MEQSNEYGKRDQISQIIRVYGAPEVILRTRGDRAVEEIPPSEIRTLAKELIQMEPTLVGEPLIQAIANLYEVGRVTANIREVFCRVLNI